MQRPSTHQKYATNPPYPVIDETKLQYPKHLKDHVWINGDYLLVDGRYGSDFLDQLKQWVVWKDKFCLQCKAPFMLHVFVELAGDYDEKWCFVRLIPSGAYPTCSHTPLMHWKQVARQSTKKHKPLPDIEDFRIPVEWKQYLKKVVKDLDNFPPPPPEITGDEDEVPF